MMQDELATLIGSRICHDLISPIGAIGNGVELLEMMSDGPPTPEMQMISGSVGNASARIRFFRLAYGSGEATSLVGKSEIRSIIAALNDGNRVQIDWQIDGSVPRASVQAAFLALQCLESALPVGGQITVAADDQALVLIALADRIEPDSRLWAMLTDQTATADITPAKVQFALLPTVLDQAGLHVAYQSQSDSLTIRIAPA